jgi:hypothetical protein
MSEQTALSRPALYWLRKWGHFGPIWSLDAFKGWGLLDECDDRERLYWDADTLREMAAAATELATWLDAVRPLSEAERRTIAGEVADQIAAFEMQTVLY